MHLLKIILVTVENCWQLQPHHLSSCHVASNPSLLEASLEMSWPQYQSPTQRMGGDLFLEIKPSEYPAWFCAGNLCTQDDPGGKQSPVGPAQAGTSTRKGIRILWQGENMLEERREKSGCTVQLYQPGNMEGAASGAWSLQTSVATKATVGEDCFSPPHCLSSPASCCSSLEKKPSARA